MTAPGGWVRRPFPALICVCQHMDSSHDFAKDGLRSGCSYMEGPVGLPCPCRRFVLVRRRYVLVGYEDEFVSDVEDVN